MRIPSWALVIPCALWTVCTAWSPIAIAAEGDAAIVGGTPVQDGDWPDAVAVLGTGGRCSGTLIAPEVVLTAGHCIDIAPWLVVLDTADLAAGDGERIGVRATYAYPGWEHGFDVGVVVLDRPARTPPRPVARTCTMREHLRRGAELTIVGFGWITADDADTNTAKHAATVPVVDARCTIDASCEESIDPGGEFIAGGGGVDACFGDSGGPAYVMTGHGPAVAGVVSRGLAGDWGCGGGGVYVRTDRVAAWIEDVTGARIARARCDGSGDDPDDGDDGADSGAGAGCAATRPPGLAVAVVLAWLLRRRAATRRRRHADGLAPAALSPARRALA